jgi:hypothetical protein
MRSAPTWMGARCMLGATWPAAAEHGSLIMYSSALRSGNIDFSVSLAGQDFLKLEKSLTERWHLVYFNVMRQSATTEPYIPLVTKQTYAMGAST